MKKKMTLLTMTLLICVAFSNTCWAGGARNAEVKVAQATTDIIECFKSNNRSKISKNLNDLIFWDAYLLLKTDNKRSINHSTVMEIVEAMDSKKPAQAYKVGYFMWLLDTKRMKKLDLTPAGLVRGRSI